MKHKKWLRFFSLLAVSLLCLCFLGGCGNSDKFSGTWWGVGEEKFGLDSRMAYIEVTIEKNGDKNYLVNIGQEAPYWVRNEKKAYLVWPKPEGNLIGTVQNNMLNMQAGTANISLTYLEKDGTLQLNCNDLMTGRTVFNLQKISEKDQDKLLDKIKEKIEEINKNDQNNKDFEIIVTDKNTTLNQLQKEHPIKDDSSFLLGHKEYNPWEKYDK